MQLILHLGMHKTGTSALQAFLRSHSEQLQQQRVLYPTHGQHHDGAHHHLWQALIDPNMTAEFARTIRTEAEEAPGQIDKIVLSSELLEKIGEDPNRRGSVPALLKAFDTVLVVYFVRNQAEVIQSIFKQWVKDDAVRLGQGPADFLNVHRKQLYYSAYAKWWMRTAENVTFRAALYNGNWSHLWASFSEITGIELDGANVSRIYNTSMDGERLKLKHWLNRNVPESYIDFPLNQWLGRHFSSRPKTTLFRTRDEYQEFQDIYREENRLITEIWGVEGLDEGRMSGAYFQTASPQLVGRFREKLQNDLTTKDSALLEFDF